MAQCEDCKEIKPVIEQADTDPVTAALTDDFENPTLPTTPPPSNTPNTQSSNSTTPETPPEITQIFGINRDFLNEMCFYASASPKQIPGASANFTPEQIQASLESNAVFDLVSEGENRVTLGSPWSSYMNENAVWGSSIRDRNFTREYTFTNEKSGDYVFKYQCDDQITIIVDGREIVKERGNFRPQHQIGVKTIRLLKGSHQIKVIGENFRGPGGMALKIYVIASYDDIQLTIDPTNNSTVPLTKSEKFVVKDGKIYIRKEAQDCGPNDNRTEDVEIGDWENILSPGSDSGDSIARGTYLYYGRPILPGSHCSGSLSPTDLEWWDFDPREESVPTGKVKLSNGTEVSVTEPTIYGYDGDGIDSPPVITDRGCN